MTTFTTTIDSPVGPLVLTSDGTALTGVLFDAEVDPTWSTEPCAVLDQAAASSASTSPASAPSSTCRSSRPARRSSATWLALREIPYAETINYGQLARGSGNPKASRAVGLANGRNPISIVVPCHRVIGADGSLTGYGGGLDRKRLLLDLERRVAGAEDPQLTPALRRTLSDLVRGHGCGLECRGRGRASCRHLEGAHPMTDAVRTPVVFIHGLWLHSSSWQPWIDLFNERGYDASAPGWPGDGDDGRGGPGQPGAVADVGVDEITDHYAKAHRQPAGQADRHRALVRRADRREAARRGLRRGRRRDRRGADQGRAALPALRAAGRVRRR